MADRRSLGDALTLTPEKLAFIQGEGASSSTTPTSSLPRRGRKPKERTVDVELSSDSHEPTDTPRISRPREKHAVSSSLPNANEVLDEVLLPLTTRVPHRLIQSLRRVCLERRLQHQKPDSIQEIVEEAIANWLSRQA
jgi:hypothetical protein